MALEEKRIHKQTTILHDLGHINVMWANQVVRDGEVISETPHRKVYTPDMRAELLDEVAPAAGLIALAGWDALPAPEPAVPRVVTMRQARLALLQQGLLQRVNDFVAALEGDTGQAARIEWEYSQEVWRDKALVRLLTPALELTEQQVDDLFVLAKTL